MAIETRLIGINRPVAFSGQVIDEQNVGPKPTTVRIEMEAVLAGARSTLAFVAQPSRGFAGAMPLNFSLTRLLTAIGAFAISLTLFSRLGIAGAIVSAVVGICFSLIALTVQVSDIRPTIRIIIAAFLGLVFGMMLTPTVRPPGQPGDEIRYPIGGIILGCFCGMIAGRR